MSVSSPKNAGLSGNELKILALIAMTCDHVGLQLLPQFPFLRILGRLAFPIYAYMIAEGCRYTRNRKKYLGKMLLLALVCQIVYYVAMDSLYQCVLVTFSLSICLIYVIDIAKARQDTGSVTMVLWSVSALCIVCLALPRLLTGTDFEIDYGIFGVLLPVMIYYSKTPQKKLVLLSLGLFLLAVAYGGIQWWGLAAVPLLACYNGTRGKRAIGNFFYLYYPLHLAVIYGISLIL